MRHSALSAYRVLRTNCWLGAAVFSALPVVMMTNLENAGLACHAKEQNNQSH